MIEGHFVDIHGNGAAALVVPVGLDVHKKSASGPTHAPRAVMRGVRKDTVCPIEIHPVVSHNSTTAMVSNLEVMPGVCSPVQWIAGNTGRPPMGQRRFCIFPGLRIPRTLRSIDHCLAIRQHLVQIDLKVGHLRRVDNIDVGVENEVRRGFIRAEGNMPALAAVVTVGHVKLPGVAIGRHAGRIRHGTSR